MQFMEAQMNILEIKNFMKKKHISQIELAEKSGVPLQTLRGIFSGKTLNPRIDTMQAIEEALGLKTITEWTDEEKALGVGRRATYLSEDEWEWLELRSDVIEVQGEDYLQTLIVMIKAAITENLKKKH